MNELMSLLGKVRIDKSIFYYLILKMILRWKLKSQHCKIKLVDIFH